MVLAFALACAVPSDRITLPVGGVDRTYRLTVPQGATGPLPLVLVFHGGGPGGKDKGANIERATRLDAVSATRGVVVAYPSSWEGNWADGRVFDQAPPASIDDVAFVDAVIEDIAGRVDLDRSRIFATGFSNGGFLSFRLACERSQVFAGFAPIIASMPEGFACAPARPVPMWAIAGKDDPWVRWDGGPVATDRGRSIPVPEAAAFWARTNGCVGEATVTELPDATPDDETRVRRHDWTGCAAPTRLDELVGMGHAWPGGSQYLPQALVGRTSAEYDAPAAVVDWFLALEAGYDAAP